MAVSLSQPKDSKYVIKMPRLPPPPQPPSSPKSKWIIEIDDGDNDEVRHKRYGYLAPTHEGMVQIFLESAIITDAQAGILLNQTPSEIESIKKQIRAELRKKCPWRMKGPIIQQVGEKSSENDLVLCPKQEYPVGWMMPNTRTGELFRVLVTAAIVGLYPKLFAEPSLEVQATELKGRLQVNERYTIVPWYMRREVLKRLIKLCADEMKQFECLQHEETEDNYRPPSQLKRYRHQLDNGGGEISTKKQKTAETLGFAAVQTMELAPQACLPVIISPKAEDSTNASFKSSETPVTSSKSTAAPDKEKPRCRTMYFQLSKLHQWKKRYEKLVSDDWNRPSCDGCHQNYSEDEYYRCTGCDTDICCDCVLEMVDSLSEIESDYGY